MKNTTFSIISLFWVLIFCWDMPQSTVFRGTMPPSCTTWWKVLPSSTSWCFQSMRWRAGNPTRTAHRWAPLSAANDHVFIGWTKSKNYLNQFKGYAQCIVALCLCLCFCLCYCFFTLPYAFAFAFAFALPLGAVRYFDLVLCTLGRKLPAHTASTKSSSPSSPRIFCLLQFLMHYCPQLLLEAEAEPPVQTLFVFTSDDEHTTQII